MPGPVYLRLSRAAAPVYYPEDMEFEIGRGITVREGGDVTIITTGTVLHKALAAAELLEAKGIQARVVDMHTIKPIDRDLIVACAEETGAIVTVEEHSVYGGLGSAVAEVLAENAPVPMTRIGATDFAESGDYEQLLVKYGYGPRPDLRVFLIQEAVKIHQGSGSPFPGLPGVQRDSQHPVPQYSVRAGIHDTSASQNHTEPGEMAH